MGTRRRGDRDARRRDARRAIRASSPRVRVDARETRRRARNANERTNDRVERLNSKRHGARADDVFVPDPEQHGDSRVPARTGRAAERDGSAETDARWTETGV